MVKVDIISGFLGAGKTTLIQKIFQSVLKNEKVVLIENEFGEIGIDGSFLKESGIQIKEINAGCICCSLVGDFESSMKEILTTYNPERIIIEPSGVGKLSDIINAVNKLKDQLEINILATVVDGVKTKMYLKNFGEFFNNQVEAADTIIVSKTDKLTEEKIDEVVKLIKQKNPQATIITTPIKELDSNQLIHVLENKTSLKDELLEQTKHHHEEGCCCHEHHEHHHHEEGCCCHEHHEHHHHEEDCCCHEHHEHHHHEEDCCCHEHHEHHHHEEGCCCHEHHEHHHHEEGCCCHEHHEHHHHEEGCCCNEHHEHHHHEEGCCCHEHHEHHHHADEVFASWGVETAKSISYNSLNKFLETLANDESLGIIIRSKGILKANDNEKWYYYDFVSGDYEIRTGNPDFTGRIVVIGSKINEKKIEELFFNIGE